MNLFDFANWRKPQAGFVAQPYWEPLADISPSPRRDVGAPSAGERSVISRIGGRQYCITADDTCLEHLTGQFEPHMAALFPALLRGSDCALDVGANIGCSSLLCSQHARQVFSFEPSPHAFRLLQKNLHAANAHNVVAANVGLGKCEESFDLGLARDHRSTIRIVAGDGYLRAARIDQVDFIRVEVEGFERKVIEGLARTIERCQPVVVLAMNHCSLNVYQRMSMPDFLDFLRGVFPVLYAIDGADVRDLHNADDAYCVMVEHIVQSFRYRNLVGAFDRARVPVVARE